VGARLRRAFALVVRAPLGAVAAAAAAAGRAEWCSAVAAVAVSLGALSTSAVLLRPWQRRASHLPVLRLAYPTVVNCLGSAACIALAPALHVEGLGVGDWILVLLAGAAGSTFNVRARARTRRAGAIRVAFIGSGEAAQRLSHDLARSKVPAYELVGMIGLGGEPDPRVPVVGALGELRAVVLREHIDLLVLGSAVARLTVFDQLASSCLDLRLQITELSEFYEDVFGHVPTPEINAAWFAHLVDAHAHHPSPTAKRTVDVLASVVLGVLTFPLMLVLALLVSLDGGPAIFAQERIGEGGRPFRLYKLRTMRVGSNDAAWAREDDPRTTVIGRTLRPMHLDELPQLFNVLRGEMSFVGPRPEQPEFVELLERLLPFYQRRHLIRPGLTGWAQVRCGYAGSERGAAWKLCNDLYYVKHRSLGLDLLLIAETAGLLLMSGTRRTGTTFVPWADTGIAPEAAVAERPLAPLLAVPPAGEIGALRLASSREHEELRGPGG
jgi:exopolysaccharide biosynthesis polyprenyl glycosylphosphotransferase